MPLRSKVGNLWLAAHADALTDYLRRSDWDGFAAALEMNNRIIEDHGHGGGKEYATFVVAAFDSTGHGRANADFVTTSASDVATLTAAVDALPADGGSIELLEGTYAPGWDINKANVHVKGQGDATVFEIGATGAAVTISAARCTVERLRVVRTAGSGTQGIVVTGNDCRVSDVHVNSLAVGIEASCFRLSIVGSNVDNCGVGIFVNSCSYVTIAGNVLWNSSSDHIVIESSIAVAVTANASRGASGSFVKIGRSGSTTYLCDGVTVAGNASDLEGSAFASVLGGSYGVVVDGNTAYRTAGPIAELISVSFCKVTGNVLVDSFDDCCVITDSSDCTVDANTIRPDLNSDLANDGIRIQGDSNRNMVANNLIRDPNFGTAGGRMRYGIYVKDAACDDNIVVHNDVNGSGTTASVQDSGTGTILSFAGLGGAGNDNRT